MNSDDVIKELTDVVTNQYDLLYSTAFRYMQEYHKAQDVVQDACYRAVRAITKGTFRRESRIITWMYAITVNAAKDALRKEKCRDVISIEHTEYSDPRSHKQSEMIDDAVRKSIHDLPEKHRVVIYANLVDDKNYQDIADEQKLSIGTVKSRIFHGKKILSRRLEQMHITPGTIQDHSVHARVSNIKKVL